MVLDQEIKVLSYNVHKGFNHFGYQFVLPSIREAIRQSKANLVCLQEVCGNRTAPILDEPDLEFLADQHWHHFAYGRNAVYPKGDHGNAILSERPIQDYTNTDLSLTSLEKRGALHAKIDHLHVITTHLNLWGYHRKTQIKKIEEILKNIPSSEPILFTGDFNDWRKKLHPIVLDLGFQEAFENHSNDLANTFPAIYPVVSLDRIYFRNLELIDAEVLHLDSKYRFSDHLPLQARFKSQRSSK